MSGWLFISHKDVERHNVMYGTVGPELNDRLYNIGFFRDIEQFAGRVILAAIRCVLARKGNFMINYPAVELGLERTRMTGVVSQLDPHIPEHIARYIVEFIM